MAAASGIEPTVNSGEKSGKPHCRPLLIQMVRRPTPAPPPTSASGESPTIQPLRGCAQSLAASSKIARSGLRAPMTDEMQTASNSSSMPAASNFAH